MGAVGGSKSDLVSSPCVLSGDCPSLLPQTTSAQWATSYWCTSGEVTCSVV